MSADSPLSAGMVLDGFRLDEPLHQGGMANLWAVTRVEPKQGEDFPLIMKVPRIKGGEDPATIVGYEVEQMLMPMLNGPHAPRYVARGDWKRQAYIVMERVPGVSLRPRLDEAPLPPEEVADIGARVADALQALHRQNVIHLDVKPSNIMIRPDGLAVLVDFGLSRHAHLPDLLEEEFELPMGTSPYMSPEQVQFVRNDPRSDIFALGVMLYHLATGERPFGQPTSVRGLRKRLYEEPVPPRAINPAIPTWLQEIILHCLEVKASRRYQSAAQLALDLRNPDTLTLTERAERIHANSGLWTRFKRWFVALGADPAAAVTSGTITGAGGARIPVQQVGAGSAIIIAAVDTDNAEPELLTQLRATVQRLASTEPGARVACVSVMKTARIGMDELTDKQGRSHHVKKLVALKDWGYPLASALELGDARLTYHVLEAPDPAGAIVEFAAKSGADHIIMGARGNSTLRRYLGSVSSAVLAESPCTVTVVRA